jgi:predicted Zn-dependent protease with MMP-like domain
MDAKQIIMSFTIPPGMDDLLVLANEIIEASLPEELTDYCGTVAIQIEEFADDATLSDIESDDPYELVALYKNGSEISPGVEKTTANDDDVLILYRRPILDLWCETGEDLATLIRQMIIEELAQNLDFSDDEIDELTSRHHQGMF